MPRVSATFSGVMPARNTHEEAQDEDHAMVGRQALESTLQLVTVSDRGVGIGRPRLDAVRLDGDLHVRLSLRLGVADSNEQPVRPALVMGRVPQPGDVSPDLDEGLLVPPLYRATRSWSMTLILDRQSVGT